MLVFEKVSPGNTAVAFKIAFDRAGELSTDIVVSTSTGASGLAAVKFAADAGFKGRLIVVTSVWGSKAPGENGTPEETRKKLEDSGACVVTAGHALSGVERAVSGKFGGVYPVEIMAHTLRMISQGVKVCVEITAMALDAGAIKIPHPVVAIGGTGKGLDTVCVITPGYSAKIFEARVHEILCKPW